MCQIIYNPQYKKYNLGANHPFDHARVEMVIDLMKELGYLKEMIVPDIASIDEILTIHGNDYVSAVEDASLGKQVNDLEKFGLGTFDNPVVEGMAEGARYQTGGTILGAQILLENKAKKVLQLGGGFHHAHKNLAAGFCLYNDLAAAIKKMTGAGWHVAYLDIDVHHGDGVHEAFYSDENVMCISFHESGEYLFPGTGWIHELGKGMGRSLKLNVPLEPFTEGESYIEVLKGIAEPALKWFKPDAVVIQAGADAHFSDPLADLMLTTQDFEIIFKTIIQIVDEYCNGRALFTLGGGYSITAASRIWSILYMTLLGFDIPEKIPEEWRAKWEAKIGKKIPESFYDLLPAFEPIPRKDEINRHNKELIRRVMDAVAGDWI